MLQYLELIFVMTAVGLPFYLYISITHYFHTKNERAARATNLKMQNQVDTIAKLEGEVKALRAKVGSLEADLNQADDKRFDINSMNRAKVA